MNQNSKEYRQYWYDECVGLVDPLTRQQEASVRHYFETGDIEKYIRDEIYIEPDIAAFLAPQHNLEHFVHRVTLCWDWMLSNENHPANQEPRKKLSADEQFSAMLGGLFFKDGSFFSDDFFMEVFNFMFGDRYIEGQQFPIEVSSHSWVPINTRRRDLQCSNVNLCLRRYLTHPVDDVYRSNIRYKGMIHYFLNTFPYISIESFDLNVYGRFHKKNGKRTGFAQSQSSVRAMLVLLYSSADKDKEVNDIEFFKRLKEQVDLLDMPEEYYRLKELVIEHGEDSLGMDLSLV